MKLQDKVGVARGIVTRVKRVSRVYTAGAEAALSESVSGQRPVSQRAEMRYTISNLRRLLRQAMGDPNDQQFVDIISNLAKNGEQVQRAVVVWIDLIEVLIQNTEQRYGSTSGRGRIKAAEVKEVINYLLRVDRLNLNLPSFPRYLMPVIIDVLVDSTIDAVVLMINRYELWIDIEPAPKSYQARFLLLLRPAYDLLRPLLVPLSSLVYRIWFAARVRVPLSPAIRSALEAIDRDGIIFNEEEFVTDVVNMIGWIGTHRQQVIAAFEVVFESVKLAEKYLSEEEKKAYARDLVLAVLDEMGFEARTGLMFAIIDSTINGVIEATLNIFTKRGGVPDQNVKAIVSS